MQGKRSGLRVAAGAGVLVATAAVVLAAGGQLDTTFGTGGNVRDAVCAQAWDVVAQGNGKTVMGGADAGGGGGRWMLRRYDAAGALDTTFGAGGSTTIFGTNGADLLLGLISDASGRLLAVGKARLAVTTGTGKKATTSIVQQAVVARFSADGAVDLTFGAGGVATIRSDAVTGQCLAVQSDGRILVGGTSESTVHGTVQRGPFVARLNANGSLDTTFASGGVALGALSTSGGTFPHGMALQSDGRIVFLSSTGSGAGALSITRYLTTGSLDSSFSAIHPADGLDRLCVDGSNRIVAVGQRAVAGGCDMVAVRYTAGGAVDTSFAGGLGATVDYAANDYVYVAPIVQADGKIVFTGTCSATSSPSAIVAVRLNDDGSRDTTFGTNGVAAAVAPGNNGNTALSGCLGADGNVLICGYSVDSSGSGNVFTGLLARYLAN